MTRSIKIAATAAAALIMAAGVPLAAHAQDTYDGYCYAKKESAKNTGTVVGAIAGGLLGSQVSKNERGLGAVGGAVIGGAIGRSVGGNSVKCLNGEYYSYQSGYYTPPAAPDGYDVVYYKTRPGQDSYSTVYYDRDRHTSPGYAYNNGYNNGGYAYNGSSSGKQGWRDSSGNWHSTMPVAFGWKDSRGRWHEGQLVAYGWQDTRGAWHETQQVAPAYGYNNGYYDSNGNGY